MLNRRTFLTRVSTGFVAACVLVKIPTSVLHASIQKSAALEYLRQAYNAHRTQTGQHPSYGVCGQGLWDAYLTELTPITRWTDDPETTSYGYVHLMFKGSSLLRHADKGWWVRFSNGSIKEFHVNR